MWRQGHFENMWWIRFKRFSLHWFVSWNCFQSYFRSCFSEPRPQDLILTPAVSHLLHGAPSEGDSGPRVAQSEILFHKKYFNDFFWFGKDFVMFVWNTTWRVFLSDNSLQKVEKILPVITDLFYHEIFLEQIQFSDGGDDTLGNSSVQLIININENNAGCMHLVWRSVSLAQTLVKTFILMFGLFEEMFRRWWANVRRALSSDWPSSSSSSVSPRASVIVNLDNFYLINSWCNVEQFKSDFITAALAGSQC